MVYIPRRALYHSAELISVVVLHWNPCLLYRLLFRPSSIGGKSLVVLRWTDAEYILVLLYRWLGVCPVLSDANCVFVCHW